MKDKYIDEKYERYFIFGESKGRADVSTTKGDIVTGISKKEAENLIKKRDELMDVIIILSKICPPKLFSALHYEGVIGLIKEIEKELSHLKNKGYYKNYLYHEEGDSFWNCPAEPNRQEEYPDEDNTCNCTYSKEITELTSLLEDLKTYL